MNNTFIDTKLILATPRGFCAGVERAVDIVNKAIDVFGSPIYVKHEVVHNKYVIEDLEKKGVSFIEDIEEVPENADLYYRMTIYLIQSGKFKEAFHYLENALILDFEKHTLLFDFFKDLEQQKALMKIIDQFRD